MNRRFRPGDFSESAEFRFRMFLTLALFSGVFAGVGAALGASSSPGDPSPDRQPVPENRHEVSVRYLGGFNPADYPFVSPRAGETAAMRRFSRICYGARDRSPAGYLCRNPRLLALEREVLVRMNRDPEIAAFLNGGTVFREFFASCMAEEHPGRCMEYTVLMALSREQIKGRETAYQDVSYECGGGTGLRVRYYDTEMPALRVCFSEDSACPDSAGEILFLFPGSRGRFFSDGSSRDDGFRDSEKLYPVRNGVRYERSPGVALNCNAESPETHRNQEPGENN